MDDVTQSYKLQFSVEVDMRRFAGEAWGPLGVRIVEQWCEFNATYFDGALRPVPLVITSTRSHMEDDSSGILLVQSREEWPAQTITLNIPQFKKVLLADNNTLLHEMVHQFCFERGARMRPTWGSHGGARSCA